MRSLTCVLTLAAAGAYGCSSSAISAAHPDATTTDSGAGGPLDAGGPDDAGSLDGGTGGSLQGQWQEIKPGGNTSCARGDEYAFYVYPGNTNRVIIDFEGGGACWTTSTCQPGSSTFTDKVDARDQQASGAARGVYDHSRSDNPFNGWNHVFVPYCTGDIHWGSNDFVYGTGTSTFTIHHRGAINARAVLDWVFANFPSPDRVLVTGCSAGAYGAIMWSPHVARHYPNAKVIEFADSGAGIVTPDFFQNSFPNWGTTAPNGAAPSFIPSLDPSHVDWTKIALPDLYARIGRFFPGMPLAQYNTFHDQTQTLFYVLMGGSQKDWPGLMDTSIQTITSTLSTFRAYTAPGNQHCILPFDDIRTQSSDGKPFIDWLSHYMNGDPVDSVHCQNCETGP